MDHWSFWLIDEYACCYGIPAYCTGDCFWKADGKAVKPFQDVAFCCWTHIAQQICGMCSWLTWQLVRYQQQNGTGALFTDKCDDNDSFKWWLQRIKHHFLILATSRQHEFRFSIRKENSNHANLFCFVCTVALKLHHGYPKRNSTQFTDVIDGIKVKK